MEILGRSIPTLQNAIASGLESVTAGITESAKAVGVAALGIAQDSFSFEQTSIASSVDLPAVSGAGEYPGPNQYFRQFPNIASDSPISSLEISKTLADPNFDVPKALHTFREGSATIVDDVIKYIEEKQSPPFKTPGQNAAEIHEAPRGELGAEIYGAPLDNRLDLPKMDGYPATDRFGQDKSDVASYAAGGSPVIDRFGKDESDVASFAAGGYSASDRFGRNKAVGTLPENNSPGAELNDYLDDLGKPDLLGDIFGSSDTQRKPIGPTLGDVTYDAVNRNGRETSDAASFAAGGYTADERFGRDKVKGTAAESLAGSENPLPTLSNDSGSMVDSALKLHNVIEQRMRDVINTKQNELEEKQEKFDDIKNYPAILAKNRLGQNQSDAASVNTDGSSSANDRFGRDKVEGTAESVAGAGNAQQLLEIGPLGKMVGLFDVSYDAADRFGRDKSDAASINTDRSYSANDRFGSEKTEGTAVGKNIRPGEALMDKPSAEQSYTAKNLEERQRPGEALMWKPIPSSAAGPTDGASNRSIIVVGGKTDSPASDRSIIVVGGKTTGTYLQTIDDSLSQLQNNPTPEASNLFTQQFGVVRDMVSTVSKTVGLQQSLASNRFTTLR